MRGSIRRGEEFEWVDLAGHKQGALTKLLVSKENNGANNMDFMISSYAPQAYAEVHMHEESEECFYFVSGTGAFELDGERHVIGPNTVVFVPPKTLHGIFNTGYEPLVFIVTSSPPEPAFHERYQEYFVDAGQPGTA